MDLRTMERKSRNRERRRDAAFAAVLAVGLCAAASATRLLEQPEGSYEAALVDVSLPESPVGRVVLSTCSACTRLALPVTPSTVYFVERAQLPLADLLQAAAEIDAEGRTGDAAVYVFYDVETRRVSRLVLDRLDD